MSGGIYISYRRDDATFQTGRLYDRLSAHFPKNQIFMDVDNLDPGVDFVQAIQQSLESCDVLIVVIGQRWLVSSEVEGSRRLENPDDFVRLEIATALKRNIRVIPVLVDGALMPRLSDLPDDLRALVRRNAVEVSHNRFSDDLDRLIAALELIFERTAAERRQREEQERLAAEQRQRVEQERLAAERGAREGQVRLEAERGAREGQERLEAERRAREELDRLEAQRRAREERERAEAESRVREEPQRLEAESRAMEEQERPEAERRARAKKPSLLAPILQTIARIRDNLSAKKRPVEESGVILRKRGAERDALDSLASILASQDSPKEAVHRAVNVQAEPERSPVDCTVFAPDRVERKQTRLLQAFLHAPEARREVEASAKQYDPAAKERGHRSLVLDAPIGATFAFDIEIEGFVFHERTDTLLWTGKPQTATFRFDVPKGCKLGQHAGTVRVSQDGAPVGRITFQIEVVLDARDAIRRPVGKEARHYHACFCSYSSLDRVEMLKRAQALRATGLETFIDVLTLRPGDIWNPKIFEAIDESDLFVVIWSKNARDSKWVKKESRYALRRYKQNKSPDFRPIPVEGPPIASVPRGLRAYHFNDELLGQIRAAELEMRGRKKEET
jgi:hypothetical protein